MNELKVEMSMTCSVGTISIMIIIIFSRLSFSLIRLPFLIKLELKQVTGIPFDVSAST